MFFLFVKFICLFKFQKEDIIRDVITNSNVESEPDNILFHNNRQTEIEQPTPLNNQLVNQSEPQQQQKNYMPENLVHKPTSIEPIPRATNKQRIPVGSHTKKQPIVIKIKASPNDVGKEKDEERPRSIPSEIINEIDGVMAAAQKQPPANKPRKRIRSRRRSDQQQQQQQQDGEGSTSNLNIYDQVHHLMLRQAASDVSISLRD